MIVFNLKGLMKQRGVKLMDLAREAGITDANMSKVKTGKTVSLKIKTLNTICRVLNCQPGDILEYRSDENSSKPTKTSKK